MAENRTEPNRIRSFAAIELPRDLKERLVALKDAVPGSREGVKWVKAEALHLTLRFLGHVPEELLETLQGSLCAIAAGSTAFTLTVKGLGTFPSRGNPRVVWAGIDTCDALARLAGQVEKACVAAGCEPERRPFSPHLTLARIKVPGKARGLAGSISSHRDLSFGTVEAREFTLFKSDLTPSGPLYTALATYRFGDSPGHAS